MTAWRRFVFGTLALLASATVLACGNGSDSYGTAGPTGPGPSGPGNDPYGDSGNGGNGAGGAGGGAIVMGDNFFDPQVDTVSVGTTVVWENEGALEHTTTSDDELWDSGNVGPGQDASHTFSDVGEFEYHCTIHVDEGMVGTVVVVE